MSDLLRMQQALMHARASDAQAVLATLVWRKGSTYRRAGARAMIVGEEVTGLLSGGCLEADIAQHAKAMLARGEPNTRITYDLASDEADSLLGIGHGCKGTLGIVLEALPKAASTTDSMALLAAHADGDQPGAVIHLPGESGPAAAFVHNTPFSVRRLWRVAGRDVAQGNIGTAEHAALTAMLDRTVTDARTHEQDGMVAEYLPRPISLLVVGAGADALPLVEFAGGLGFRITIMDHRPAALAHPRLASVTRQHVKKSELGARTRTAHTRAAVIMTHNLESDQAALAGLLSRDGPTHEYVGVLGPRARTEKMLAEIGTTLAAHPELRAPAGLDLGGDGADSIALAIVSEIHARLHARNGSALTLKEGPIHGQ